MPLFATMRSPRAVVFGAGQRHVAARYAAGFGKRALICTDERLGADPVLATLVAELQAEGMEVQVYDRTAPEVPLASIAEGLEIGRAFGPDLVIGLGGGSCLDMAKVTALLLAHPGSPRDYYGEFRIPGPVLPLIAIPTTAGTGSEVTPVAVIADSERALKVGIASPYLIPLVAICDPELTYSCPPGLTAIAGADALTHAIEAVTSAPRQPSPGLSLDHVFLGKNAMSDVEGFTAIGHLASSLARAVHHGDDTEARDRVMFGAMMAGLAFGTAGTAAAHAIQYPVGAATHTAHGAGVACLLPYVMEYNLPGAIESMAEVARAMGVARPDAAPRDNAYAAIDAVAQLFGDIGIPADLEALGLARDQLDWTAEQSMGAARLVKNNPRPLDVTVMRNIIDHAWRGDRTGLRKAMHSY